MVFHNVHGEHTYTRTFFKKQSDIFSYRACRFSISLASISATLMEYDPLLPSAVINTSKSLEERAPTSMLNIMLDMSCWNPTLSIMSIYLPFYTSLLSSPLSFLLSPLSSLLSLLSCPLFSHFGLHNQSSNHSNFHRSVPVYCLWRYTTVPW